MSRTTSRPGIALDLIRTLSERLGAADKPAYDKHPHDEAVDFYGSSPKVDEFNDPTGDLINDQFERASRAPQKSKP